MQVDLNLKVSCRSEGLKCLFKGLIAKNVILLDLGSLICLTSGAIGESGL